MHVNYGLIITFWIIHIKKTKVIRPFLFFFVRFCDNISCVSLGRAHWPRAAVAARGPGGFG